jgi:hypothetical protein
VARAKLVVATVVVLGAGAGLWALVESQESTPPAPTAAPRVARARDAAPTPDATLRRAPIAPLRPAAGSGGPRVAPPPGGFAAWTGLEGTRPGELEAMAAAQGVPLDVAQEARRLLWLVELSRNRDLVAELAGRPLADTDWTALVALGTDAQRTGNQLVEDLRGGTIDAPTTISQLRELETDYRSGFEQRTGLTGAQFDELFARAELTLGD